MDKYLTNIASKSPGYRTSSPKNKPLAKVASYKKRIGTAALKDHNKINKNAFKGDKSFKIYEDSECKEDENKKKSPLQANLVDEECQTDGSPCFCSCHIEDKSNAETSIDLGSSIPVDPEELEFRKQMQAEEIPDDYWHWVGVAHSKSEMLDQTMEEALQLTEEVEKLKEQNARLSKVADYSFYFASVLESLLDDTAEDSGISDISKCLATYKDLAKDIDKASTSSSEPANQEAPKDGNEDRHDDEAA